MTSNFKGHKMSVFIIVFALVSFCGFSQGDTKTFKAQIAFGVNTPSASGFVNDFEAKAINFPTINLGVQYMFKPQFGTKLDFGYNRFSNLDNSPEFKVNYSRFNVQFVYDASEALNFLPQRMGVFGHAGPGYTFIKPLNSYTENKTSFFNVMTGIEFHYGVSETFSVYADASYILGLSKDFDPVSDGNGSFNGNLLAITIGASVSLSGCYFCDE